MVFPDLWTMHQQLPARLFEQWGVARRHSGLSVWQKAAIFRWCKQWTLHTLVTTPAGIFQDWHDLGSIFLVDAHKWWYKSVQDPRYWTPTVITTFCEMFSCKVMTSGVLLSVPVSSS
jgi:primosomal protein N'